MNKIQKKFLLISCLFIAAPLKISAVLTTKQAYANLNTALEAFKANPTSQDAAKRLEDAYNQIAAPAVKKAVDARIQAAGVDMAEVKDISTGTKVSPAIPTKAPAAEDPAKEKAAEEQARKEAAEAARKADEEAKKLKEAEEKAEKAVEEAIEKANKTAENDYNTTRASMFTITFSPDMYSGLITRAREENDEHAINEAILKIENVLDNRRKDAQTAEKLLERMQAAQIENLINNTQSLVQEMKREHIIQELLDKAKEAKELIVISNKFTQWAKEATLAEETATEATKKEGNIFGYLSNKKDEESITSVENEVKAAQEIVGELLQKFKELIAEAKIDAQNNDKLAKQLDVIGVKNSKDIVKRYNTLQTKLQELQTLSKKLNDHLQKTKATKAWHESAYEFLKSSRKKHDEYEALYQQGYILGMGPWTLTATLDQAKKILNDLKSETAKYKQLDENYPRSDFVEKDLQIVPVGQDGEGKNELAVRNHELEEAIRYLENSIREREKQPSGTSSSAPKAPVEDMSTWDVKQFEKKYNALFSGDDAAYSGTQDEAKAFSKALDEKIKTLKSKPARDVLGRYKRDIDQEIKS